MDILVGAVTLGLILSVMVMGVFISYRVFNFSDLSPEGSFSLGGAITSVIIVSHGHPIYAMIAAFLGGSMAGIVTGFLYARCKISKVLSGFLVMTALYSINLNVMGKSNIPLLEETTLLDLFIRWCPQTVKSALSHDAIVMLSIAMAVLGIAAILFLFFKTEIGSAMRATGNNSQMVRALGISAERMTITGLGISNGLVAVSGAFLVQYQGFCDVQMGIGILVVGLASLIIGETIFGVKKIGAILGCSIVGSILFRLLVTIALQCGMNPNDLKVVTAFFVFATLVIPKILSARKNK